MTRRECAIVSAYTGVLCGDWLWFRAYIEELLGRPVYTHEFANPDFIRAIKELSKEDFIALGQDQAETFVTDWSQDY